MQRTILRTIAVMSVMCLCYLIPPQVLANVSDYGPERDPVISDKSENISLTCPPPITVDCDEDGIYMTFAEFEAAGGSVNLPDGCVVDSFTFVADIQSSQNGCTFVYMRQYFISETCGNTFTCNQIVMQTDDDDPVIVGTPADTTFSVTASPCTVAFMVPELSATDGCSEATVTNNAPSDFSIGATVVVYTAMDQCGNESQDSFTVNVINNSPIIVTCPPGIMDTTVCDSDGVAAYVDFTAFVAAGGSATRDCDSAGTTFVLESFFDVQLGGSCPKTVNRTYVISDGNGNVDSCIQLITIVDNGGPSFTVPADMMDVDCAVAQDTSITGAPTDIMDNCDSMFVVTFEDMVTAGSCMGEDTITRTWTVADQCDNETQEIQTIITVDNTPPTAICKDTFYVYLDTSGFTPIVADSLDNGSSDACSDVTFSADATFAGCNEVNIPKTVLLFVEDDCGNKDTCELIVIALDTMEVVLTAPANDTVQCITDVEPVFPDTTGFEVLNNCPAGSSFAMIQADTNGVCPIIITRIYEYSDLSGNSDTALHTIFVIDTIAPVIDSCPMDITISEMDICDTLLVFGLPDVTENCDDVTITNNYTNDTSSMATFSGGTTVILFTATDGCGNQDTCSMTVTVDAAPKITCPPMGIIDSEDDLPDYPNLDAFLMAGGMINAFCAFDTSTFMYTSSFVIDSCTATITETISISDSMGNPVVETKMSMAMDTLNPVITNCNDQFVPLNSITCEIDTNFTLPTVTDNFDVDTTYFTLGAFEDDTALVVFFAEDFCGNIDSCDFEIIIYDPTSPDLDIDDITIMCDSTGAAPAYSTLDEFLAAPGASIVECRIDTSTFGLDTTYVNMNGDSVRVYSIDDLEGQTGTVMQTIFVMDSTNPEFTMCTNDISVSAEIDTCGANVMVPLPIFMDNCDTITLTNDYNGTDDASDFYIVGSTTVIWTIEDGNGLIDTCSFVVTVTDTTPPDVECPGDTMITCTIDNYPPFDSIPDFIAGGGQASDNCGLDSISSETILTMPNIYTRTYTVYDVNGLQDTCTQTIEIIDTLAPVFMTCDPLFFNTSTMSCDVFINIGPPIITDNCDTSVMITNSFNGQDSISGTFSGTTTVTWYAQDDFGNVDSCVFDIIVNDASGPVATDPDTTMIMCESMLADVDTFMTVQDIIDAGGSATDNCGIDSINLIQTTITNGLAKRTYNIIDSSGNSSTINHFIEIEDTTPPTFEAPDDVTVQCDDNVDDLSITGTVDSSMLADNCMDIDTLIYTDIVDSGICPFINEITRIWILSDNSGNETRDTQFISTIDTIAPVFDSMPGNLADIDCDGVFPAQEVITATDNCTGATVLMDTIPFMENVCAGYEVTYRWISIDSCDNQDTITRSFEVLPDTSPPSLVNANDTIVGAESDICGIRVDNVLKPIFDEDCSMIDTLISNYTDTIYPVGTTYVLWTAQNECGMEDTVTQVINVIDTIPPVVMCKNATAGITSDPQNFVYASAFVVSATDNCTIDSILVVRMTDVCGLGDITTFKDSIPICCEDVGTTIDVMIKVVDNSGLVNFCNATLEVQDNRHPDVVEALPDITISCSFVFDTLEMDVFGTFTSDPDAREEIRIEDIFYESQDSIAGLDGLVSDECTVTIADTTIVNLNDCNIGTISRIFTFTDLAGNETTSEQIIEIQDVSPFNENGTDIEWPDDFTWDQCGVPAPDTSIAGAPIFTNLDKCAQVSASFKDLLFNFPTTSCPKVRRKWQVIDWCQYDEDQTPNPGLWTYNQYIIVENNVPPTIISGCTDTLICAPNNECSATVSLGIEAEDDCGADSQYLRYAYTINVHSDSNTGNDISGDESSFSLELENGIHEVTWVVEDRCGNETTCSYTLSVNECKDPTAVCLSGLIIVLDEDGQAELWASDVNQSSNDNCTDEDDLIFSFSSDVENFGMEFNCGDVGTSQYIEMWVTDLEGNQSFCSTYVDVQDNNGACNDIIGNDDPNALQGKIATESNIAIPEAMVSIVGAEMDEDFMTAEDGAYTFEGINVENDYQIKVDRDKEDMEGVSTLDLVLIQRHILGLDMLESPYKLIAADINNSESISASDLLELRKMILGIEEKFPNNESWRFVSMNGDMDDMNNPWPFSEDLIVGNAPLQEIDADFVGVKIGDVNNTVDNVWDEKSIENRNDKSFGIVTKDQRVQRDDEVFVDFLSSIDVDLEAMQMTIEWDKALMNFMDIIPIGLQIPESFINKNRVEEGIITIAWTSVDGKAIQSGMPLFQVIFEGNRSFNLSDHLSISSKVTEAIAYDQYDLKHDIELRFVEATSQGLMMFQNKPNPFASETEVEFTLPEDMEVTFKVFNSAGGLIFKYTQMYPEGINAFKLGEQLRENRGLLFLKMETAEFSDIKRMIRIE